MTGLIIKGVLILAAMAALVYGVHVVLEHFREEGRTEVRKELQPKIDSLTADLATSQSNEKVLKKVIGDTNLYVDQLQAQIKTAKDIAAKAIAAGKEQAKLYDASIADLITRLNAPPTLDVTAACVAAQKIIDGLIEGAR